MRWWLSRGLWATLLIAATTAATGLLRGGRGDDAEADRIAGLVQQLGDAKFLQRQEASRALEAVGESALPALRKAAAASTDAEIRRRAQQLVDAILEKSSRSPSLGLQLAALDAGEFPMGSPDGETGRRPDESRHRVRITRPFLLGAYEVTQAEYRSVMKTNPSWFRGVRDGKVLGDQTERFPVESVTWYDAVAFCNRLSEQDGFAPYYRLADVKREGDTITSAGVTVAGGNGYRLPTEAEWEYACRAKTTTLYHFGDETKKGLLNCKPLKIAGGYGGTLKWPDLGRPAPVGSCPPNGFGLYDMHGNVAEWCWDWYDKDYYDRSPKEDPTGPERGTHRVQRGGSWMVGEGSCRSASRFLHVPNERKDYAGFRVARTLGPPAPGK